MATGQTLSENQDIIINVLRKNNDSMTLLALKKESRLANLYFFQALNVLKEKMMVTEDKRAKTTIISLKE
ncbi:MAG: hypothetical protein ACW97Z_18065 [Candidatus Hodarchaeales archaeon]|jgi:hypothetical protein